MLVRKAAVGEPQERASAQTQQSTALFHLPSGQLARAMASAGVIMLQIAARIWGVRRRGHHGDTGRKPTGN